MVTHSWAATTHAEQPWRRLRDEGNYGNKSTAGQQQVFKAGRQSGTMMSIQPGLRNNKPASLSVQRPVSVATLVKGTSPRLDEKQLRFDGDSEGIPSFLIVAPREGERVSRIQICIPYFKIGGAWNRGQPLRGGNVVGNDRQQKVCVWSRTVAGPLLWIMAMNRSAPAPCFIQQHIPSPSLLIIITRKQMNNNGAQILRVKPC